MNRIQQTLLALSLIVIAGTAAFIHYYNPFQPGDLDLFLSKELTRIPKLHSISQEGMTHATHTQVLKKYDSQWKKIEDAMHESGASDTEVRGVITTARKHFSYIDDYSGFNYGVPVDAKRVWFRFKPIWIIKFRWGVGYEDPKTGLTEPPSHIRVLAIDAREPYKQLAMQTCS